MPQTSRNQEINAVTTIFTVSRAELMHLGAEPAVDIVRRLLLAEASSLGIEHSLINVPLNVDAKDGGIDAEVVAPSIARGHGIIVPGLSRFQIKAGKFGVTE